MAEEETPLPTTQETIDAAKLTAIGDAQDFQTTGIITQDKLNAIRTEIRDIQNRFRSFDSKGLAIQQAIIAIRNREPDRPIYFINEKGNSTTVPASVIANDVTGFRTTEDPVTGEMTPDWKVRTGLTNKLKVLQTNEDDTQRDLIARYEVGDLTDLQKRGIERIYDPETGEGFADKYKQELTDAGKHFDTAETTLDTSLATLSTAKNLLTGEDTELTKAFGEMDTASSLLYGGIDPVTGKERETNLTEAFGDFDTARGYLKDRGTYTTDYREDAKIAFDNAISAVKTPVDLVEKQLKSLGTEFDSLGTAAKNELLKLAKATDTDYEAAITKGGTALGALAGYGTTGQQNLGTIQDKIEARTASGIGGLDATTAQFDPSGISGFFNTFNDEVVDIVLRDIQREGEKTKNIAAAKAVSVGAFGGSRSAIEQSEIDKNILETKADTASKLRLQGFFEAADRADKAFEAALGRQQKVAELTSELGRTSGATQAQIAESGIQTVMRPEELALQTAINEAGLDIDLLKGTTMADIAAYDQESTSMRDFANILNMRVKNPGLLADTGIKAAMGIGSLGTDYGQLSQQDLSTMAKLALDQGGLTIDQSTAMNNIAKGRAGTQINKADSVAKIGNYEGVTGERYSKLGGAELMNAETIAALEAQNIANLITGGSIEAANEAALLNAERLNKQAEDYTAAGGIGLVTDVINNVGTSGMVAANPVYNTANTGGGGTNWVGTVADLAKTVGNLSVV
tara:strand:+ start:300 stop:2531 length:2232 start_codon:yes stop_codon:yes gene_type:complete